MPEPDMIEDPYGATVDAYRAAGWTGALPVPYGSKFPPPTGYTGEGAPWPTAADIAAWRARGKPQNIALRMPPNVIVLDLDDPTGIFELAKSLGPLPATWRADSGGARLGHLYFRLPPGVTSTGWKAPCLGVDLLRHGHRYSVVWPSLHPNGTRYQWSPPAGDDSGRPFPTTGDLPELPASWIAHLSGAAPAAATDTGTTESINLGPDDKPGIGTPITTNRDDTLSAYTASLMKRGLSREEAWPVAQLRIADVVDPDPKWPFTRKDFDRWWDSAARKPELQPDPGPEVDPETGKRVWPWVDWRALWAEPDEEDWILEPLVPARRAVALYSAPKLGKSLLMLELAVAISRGLPVIGVTPKRAETVLYVDFENDPRGDVRTRLRDMGFTPEDLDNLRYLSFPDIGALDRPNGGEQLLDAATQAGAALVVIDTVGRTIDGKENENDTWLAFYRNTGRHLKEAGIAYIRLDHSGKDEDKGMRGGSAKASDVDAVWQLTRTSADGAEPREFLLYCEAPRMHIPEKNRTIGLRRLLNPLRHERFTYEKFVAEVRRKAEIWAAIDESGLILDPPPDGTQSWNKIREICVDAGIPGAGRKDNRDSNPFVAAVKAMAEYRRTGFIPVWAPGAENAGLRIVGATQPTTDE